MAVAYGSNGIDDESMIVPDMPVGGYLASMLMLVWCEGGDVAVQPGQGCGEWDDCLWFSVQYLVRYG